MIEVQTRVERAFRLAASPDAAGAFLADVPRWGALFPRVASVEPLPDAGPDAFLWRLDPLGPPGVEVRTVYACRYRWGPGHDLAWTPVEGVGNARFEGGVRLADGAPGTAGALRLEATLDVPAPRFVRAVVEAAVNVEMGRMTDTFLDRLDDALRGGA